MVGYLMALNRTTNTFENDPFFSGFPSFPAFGSSMFRNDPFFSGFPELSASSRSDQSRQLAARSGSMALWPFGREDPFARMHAAMNTMMSDAQSQSGGAHSFSSSSVMHYSSSGNGKPPRVYHATTSTRQAPGGIKETRKSVRDSESGMHKMSIGHHINDRSHTIERRVNTKTKDSEEHQEFVNLEEDESSQFDHEWQERSRHANTLLQRSSRVLPTLDTPTSRHHPYEHPRPLRSQLDPELGGVRGLGLSESSRKPAQEKKRHKTHSRVKDSKKKVHF